MILGRANIVELLIKNGADTQITDNKLRSPLYLASERGNNILIWINSKDFLFKTVLLIFYRLRKGCRFTYKE